MADFGAWERQDAVPRIDGARRASNQKGPFSVSKLFDFSCIFPSWRAAVGSPHTKVRERVRETQYDAPARHRGPADTAWGRF